MASKQTIITLIGVAVLALLPLPAQDGLNDWEEKIAVFESGYNADSLAFYYRKIADHHRQQDSLALWAYAWWDWQAAVFEDAPLALALLDTVVQNAWRAPQTAEEAEAMLWVQVNRGYHLFQLGKVLASVKAYEEALRLYQQYPMPDFEALEYLYLPLGAHYTRLGDNEKARALYSNAIQKHPQGPQDGALAGLYNNIGLTYWNEGDQENALHAYAKGLACEDLPPIKSALLHFSTAQSLLALGRSAEAETQVETAIAGLRKLKGEEALNDYLSGAYVVKAKLLLDKGDPATALSYLKAAKVFIQIARGTAQHRDIAKIQIELGRLYLHTGDDARALGAFHEALGGLIPGFPAGDENALPAAEQLYEENAIYEALEGKADALFARYLRDKDAEGLRRALDCHRLAAMVEIRLRRLLQYESSKISLLSQSRQRAAKAITIARELYAATADESFLYEAWATAEQVKSVLLLEAVQDNRFRGQMEADDPLPAEERRIRQQTAYFERLLLLEPASPLRTAWVGQLEELKQQLAETGRRLQEQYPAWAALRVQSETFSVASIKALRDTLPEHALLEYFVSDTHIEVFGQSPEGRAIWKTIGQADSLGAKTRQLLSLLQSRTALQSPSAYREAAYGLYVQILQPALSALGKPPRNLLIIPDAWLAFVPFEALYDEPAPQASWERAPFLLRRYGIQYAFSLAVLEGQRSMHAKARCNLVQFAPRFEAGQRNLPPLLQSADEAPVSRLCKSKLYTDGQAGLDELRRTAANYSVLHLSTHAAVDTGGLLPRVEMYDRAAYLPDVYALSLQADLVVLSACQTALGQFRNGEGVMSLSRAFTYAGAKGLVAGLWTINEGATADLFRRMYVELRSGVAKPIALQGAKLQYLDDPKVPAYEKSPYYWAGLVYTGDDSAIAWQSCGWSPWWLLLVLLLPAFGVVWKRRRLKKNSNPTI